MKKKFRFIIAAGLIVILGALCALTLVTCKNCNKTEYVTITFETGAGSNVDPIKVEKGAKAPQIPSPTMIGATFENWYYDNGLINQFSYDDVIEEDLTLYANYELDISDLNVNESTDHYEDNCDKTKQITVVAPKGLSKEQFLNSVSIEAVTGDLPNIDVAISEDEYTIIPLNIEGATESGYEAGKLYKVTIPNNYRFKDLESRVRNYTFRIYKEQVEYAEVNENIKYLLTSDIVFFDAEEDDAYELLIPQSLFNTHKLEVNDIVSISENYKYDDDNQMTLDTDNATVVKITGYTQLETGDYIVNAVQATLGEMFSDINYYGSSTIPVEDIIAEIEKADIEEELKNSEGVKKMSRLLARSIGNSSSVRKALGDDEDFTSNTYLIQDTIEQISIKFQDVRITVNIGKGHNPNFDDSLDDDFCVIQFKFEYEATIKKKIKIKAELELTQYIAVTMQGDSDFSLKNLYLRFDYAFNVYSQTDIDLTVLMCSIDEDDEEYRDISDEISNKLASSTEENNDNSNLITELQDMLDNDSGDIEIMKVPIIKAKVPVIPIIHVFDVNTNLDFVIKVNFGAGINIDASVLEAVQIGAKGDTSTGNIQSYKHQLPGGDQYSLELSACGYLGVKLGFEASLTISFCGASKFGEVGLAVFVGPYVDLYGYVKMSLSRIGYVPSQYGQKKVTSTVIGGYYIEIGINVQVELIARSDFFKVKAGVDLLNYKIPIVTFGSKDVLYNVVEQEEEPVVLMNDSTNADKFTIDYRNFIYAKGEFLDITTGETNIKDISYNKLHMTFDNRCFSYDNLKGVIIYDRSKNGGALTDECTVTMYYTDSYLMFSSNSSNFYKCPAGTVKLIWTDTNKVPVESAGKTYNATIQFIIDGELVEERIQPVRAGTTLGYIPNQYDNVNYDNKVWNLDSFTEVITDDITFTFNAKTRLVYVAFMYYDMENCKWKMEIRTVKLGETPVAPEIQTESEKVHFNYWKASTGNVARKQAISPIGLSPVIDSDYIYKYGYISSQFVTGYESNQVVKEWEGEDYYDVYNKLRQERIESGSQYYYILTHIYEADYLFNDCTLSVVFPDDINGENNYNYDLTVPYGATYLNYQLHYIIPYDRTFLGYSLNEDLSNPFTISKMPKITQDTTIYFVYGYKDYNVKIYYYDDTKDEYIIYDDDYIYSGMDNLNNLKTEAENSLVKENGVSYEFLGWINKFNNKYTKLTEVTGDLELYPNYLKTYDITFDPNGGKLNSLSVEGNTITTSSSLFNGKNSTLLEINASREDEQYEYEFLGWEDEKGTIYNAYFSYEFTGPTTLKAVWGNPVEKTYNVVVIADHDVLLNGQNTDYYEGNYEGYLEFINKYRQYSTPELEENGYKITFKLKEDKINGAEYVNYLSYESTNELLQYVVSINANGGKLTKDSIDALVNTGTKNYEIKYLGEKIENGNNIYEFKYYYGRSVILSKLNPQKDDTLKARYSFNNYTINNESYSETDVYKVTSNVTLNINWNEELIDYTVTYYVNDAIVHTDTYHYEDEIIVLTRPTNTMKYKWSGWTWYTGNESSITTPTKMLDNYIVKSTTEEVKITYIVDGKTTKEEVVDANSTVTLIDKVQKEGYEVTDWMSDGITIENNSFIMPEYDVTFTSTTTKKTYKVTYLKDNGEKYNTFEYLFGETVSVIDLPEEEGKYFTWVSDDVSIIGSSFTIPAKDITIKLKEFNKQYRLSYVINNTILKYEYVTPLVNKEIDSTLFDGKFEGTFSGWYSKEVEIKDNTFTTIETDIYLYGYYTTGDVKINVYLDETDEVSLVLYGNSGSVINGYNEYHSINNSLSDDGVVESSAILIKLYNYNISGWLMNSTELYPSIRLDDNMETINIKAYYEKMYKVSYDINDLGNYIMSTEELEEKYMSKYYYSGDKVYLEDLPILKEYEYRSNYYMLDWFSVNVVELSTDENGTYFIMPEYDVTFNTTEYYKVDGENAYKASMYIKLPNQEEKLYCEYTVDEITQFSAVAPIIDGYYCICLKDEEGNEYENYDYINYDVMAGKNKKFIAIYEKTTQQMLTLRINGEVYMGIEFDSYLGGYITIPYISVEGFKLLGLYSEYGVIEYMDDGTGEYKDISIYIEKELLGEDFIFDALTIQDSSSFSLNISFADISDSIELLAINYDEEGQPEINIIEGTTLVVNNQYAENIYDIKLYLSSDFENYVDISNNYLECDNDLVYIVIPNVEDILEILNISELGTISITINYIVQTNS